MIRALWQGSECSVAFGCFPEGVFLLRQSAVLCKLAVKREIASAPSSFALQSVSIKPNRRAVELFEPARKDEVTPEGWELHRLERWNWRGSPAYFPLTCFCFDKC